VLIEINIAGEAAKSGVAPDSSELEEMLNVAASCESIEIRGLMTVPPYDDESGETPVPTSEKCALCSSRSQLEACQP